MKINPENRSGTPYVIDALRQRGNIGQLSGMDRDGFLILMQHLGTKYGDSLPWQVQELFTITYESRNTLPIIVMPKVSHEGKTNDLNDLDELLRCVVSAIYLNVPEARDMPNPFEATELRATNLPDRAKATGRLAPIGVQDGNDPGRTNPGDKSLADPLTHIRFYLPDDKALANVKATLTIGGTSPDGHTTFFDERTRREWLRDDPDNSPASDQPPVTTEPSSSTHDWRDSLLQLSIEAAIAESEGRTPYIPPQTVPVVESEQRPRGEQFPLRTPPTLSPKVRGQIKAALKARLEGKAAAASLSSGRNSAQSQEAPERPQSIISRAYSLVKRISDTTEFNTLTHTQDRILLLSTIKGPGGRTYMRKNRISFNPQARIVAMRQGQEGIRIYTQKGRLEVDYSRNCDDPVETRTISINSRSSDAEVARSMLALLGIHLEYAFQSTPEPMDTNYIAARAILKDMDAAIARRFDLHTITTNTLRAAQDIMERAREEVGKAMFDEKGVSPVLVGIMKVATPMIGVGINFTQVISDIFSLDGDNSSSSTQIRKSISDRLHDAGDKAVDVIDWLSHKTRLYDVGRWMAMDQRDYLEQRIARITRAMQGAQQEKRSSQDDPQLDEFRRVVRQAGEEVANRAPIPATDPRANAFGRTGPAEPLWEVGALNGMSAEEALRQLQTRRSIIA